MSENKIIKFLTADIWHLDAEGYKKILIKELQILILQMKLFFRNFALTKASSLAFTSLLSLIPVLAVLFMFFKLFGGKGVVEETIKPFIYEFLTAGSGDKISEYIDSFINSATIETLGTIGIAFLFIAVYSILSSIESNFNDIWDVKRNRSFLDQIKSYTLILIVIPILITFTIAITSKLETVLQSNSLDMVWGFSLLIIFDKIFPFFLVILMFFSLIKIIPNCKVHKKSAFIGAAVGTILYFISKNIFVYYTKMAVSYNVIYGSIAILPFFMLWLYFFWIIVLLSVQITFVRQNLHNLKYLEKVFLINRIDKIKIAVMVSFMIVKKFIKKSDSSDGVVKSKNNYLSIDDISAELDIPLKDIRKCLSDFEKSGILAELANNLECYIPNIPLNDFTLRAVIGSVDKKYLISNKYESENKFSAIKDLVKNGDLNKEIDLEISIEKMLKEAKHNSDKEEK